MGRLVRLLVLVLAVGALAGSAWGDILVWMDDPPPLPAGIIVCTEDASAGCVYDFRIGSVAFVGGPVTTLGNIIVASDGEIAFNPFGYPGGDTSDDVEFGSFATPWSPQMGVGNAWTSFADTAGPTVIDPHGLLGAPAWALPALTSCGGENEPVCEDVGKWYHPGSLWENGGFVALFVESDDATLSDLIIFDNSGPGGAAAVTMESDPIPDGGMTLMLLGGVLAGLETLRRRFRA